MSHPKLSILLFLLTCMGHVVMAQADSALQTLQQIPAKYIQKVDAKIDQYSNRLTGKTEKTLIKLSRWENKIHTLLQKADPAAAERLFGQGQPSFGSMLKKLQEGKAVAAGYRAQYNSYRDQLTTGIKYLQAQKDKLDSNMRGPLNKTAEKLDSLEAGIAVSENMVQFIKQRKKQLYEGALKYIGKSKYLAKINKESYYYVETLKNYKEIFSDPSKREATAKELLNKIPAFRQFAQQNSMLSSLFRTPAGSAAQSIAGLQTRAGINTMLQDRLGSSGANVSQVISQNMQAAQAEMSKLKAQLVKAGGNSTADNLPDFKPNGQRSKTFKQRLEPGVNIQFAKGNNLVPSSTDIALSLGYKLNDKSTAGIGLSYKMGLGPVHRFSISHQGMGLRSFIDWKLKKQFFISGGYEMNYNSSFKKIGQLKEVDSWQRSGLIGISKKMPSASKWAKAAKLSLLHDLLYKQHYPQTQPFLYRIGYNF